MTHVSKRRLSDKKESELFDQMYKIIARLDAHSTQQFFSDLLGPEEKLMLAKRLAAIILYIEGNSSYRVWTLLQISPSTAERIRLKYQIGNYNEIKKCITKNKSVYKDVLKILETVLQAGLPPRGRGRWKRTLNHIRG